ncbi:alpha/beta hydrolase-fold protein [Pseudoalteromonas xiamenensis]|uniref:alpha/beta hydrolase-fold protein n=1 Tax=Pseudoalteromonas xiamenensis TaxID=882626 RepID=UPI0027E42E0C|nr:alpha/beta hydrolase-fold protein [Pseudoalteromonas xiamenensis]WMN59592.1 alpha/beta hydrolase-fold protein [Pseudoalteromonas xiamenensis]
MRLLLIFLFLITSMSSQAAESTLNIDSARLNQSINVKIYTPKSYDLVNKTNYPVIYLLDGDAHANHTVTNSAFLNSTGVMPELIVVAISTVERFTYFTPTLDKNSGRDSGKADLYAQFLTSELMPEINKNYRVSGFNMVAGHSLGGLFCAYILQSQPDMFDAYYLFSPSLWWDNEVLAKHTDFKSRATLPFVYMSIANEQGKQRTAYQNYQAKLSEVYPNAVFQEFPNEDHMTTPLLSQIGAFRAQFADWLLSFDDVVSNPQRFITHYQTINAKFGTTAQGQEWEIGQPVQHIVNELKDANKALVASDVHLTMFPNSQWAYKSKADALALKGDKSAAITHMEKAVSIAKEHNDKYLEMLQASLTSLKERQF